PHLPGSHVLDLFAGQGRFSYSALAEGAACATLVENNTVTARELSTLRPKKIPSSQESRVFCQDAWTFLAENSGDLYDIIFADPPFEDWNSQMETKLFNLVSHFCKPGTILLVKYPSEMLISSEHPGFSMWKINHFGESQLAYFTYGQS
ncbi:MAG: RsmD family RNA methyltransferase, partial [Pseudomonadota bacterium]